MARGRGTGRGGGQPRPPGGRPRRDPRRALRVPPPSLRWKCPAGGAALAIEGGSADDPAAKAAEDAAAKAGDKFFHDAAAGSESKSCSTCHDNPKRPELSLKGVGARFPRYDKEAGKVITLQEKFAQMFDRKLKGKKPIPLGDARFTALEIYLKGLK